MDEQEWIALNTRSIAEISSFLDFYSRPEHGLKLVAEDENGKRREYRGYEQVWAYVSNVEEE